MASRGGGGARTLANLNPPAAMIRLDMPGALRQTLQADRQVRSLERDKSPAALQWGPFVTILLGGGAQFCKLGELFSPSFQVIMSQASDS